ncbi:hypothetical protein [Chryseobacterium proteolyticum]|uniref:hypothetical protein n=1 Tax=Chryseobacterium proteolyticum TaxID=118127 RepID=UPI003982F86C
MKILLRDSSITAKLQVNEKDTVMLCKIALKNLKNNMRNSILLLFFCIYLLQSCKKELPRKDYIELIKNNGTTSKATYKNVRLKSHISLNWFKKYYFKIHSVPNKKPLQYSGFLL